jgi:hypothetical protein
VNQVNGRETNQQNRIANGVKNGSLSPKQTSNLEEREANVQSREKKDMAAPTVISQWNQSAAESNQQEYL